MHFLNLSAFQGFTKLWAIMVCCSAMQAQADEFTFGDVRGVATQEGAVLRLTANTALLHDTVPATSRLIRLQDGFFAQAEDGTLTLLSEAGGEHDPDWQTLKDRLENATIEPEVGTELPLVFELAFRAQLDANPATTLDTLLARGVVIEEARDMTWTFDRANSDHVERATEALGILAQAVSSGDIRVAGTASRLLLGFSTQDVGDKPELVWPENPEERLTLAPILASRTAYAVEEIGDRLLIGQPDWFVAAPEGQGSMVACLPFSGCGYVQAEAVIPVRPVWITFDRESLKPISLTLD